MKSKALWVLLVSSVAVNVLAGGYFYQQLTPSVDQAMDRSERDPGRNGFPHRDKGERPSPVTHMLPEAKRQEFDALRDKNREVLKEKFGELRKEKEALLAILKADDFSEEAYKKQLDKVIGIQNDMYRIRVQPVLTITKSLSTEERKAFIEALQDRKDKMGGRPPHRPGGMPPRQGHPDELGEKPGKPGEHGKPGEPGELGEPGEHHPQP